MRRALVALAVAAITAAACERLPGASNSTFHVTATLGPKKIGTRVVQLVDATRTLEGRRGGASTNGRPLPTTLYYPANDAGRDAPVNTAGMPYALVVFSHGLRGTPDDYAPLLQFWAGQGYIVAAPTFPLTNRDADPVVPGDLLNQPADVSFVISSLIAMSADTRDPLSGAIDPRRVIAAGHSEGALTTVMLFAQCCVETRLVGAVIMAGDDIGTQGKAFTAPPKPLLYIHGDQDKVVSYELGQRSYRGAPEPKAFLTLVGAGHIDPYVRNATGPAADAVRNATGYFFAYLTGPDANSAHAGLKNIGGQSGVTTLDDHLR